MPKIIPEMEKKIIDAAIAVFLRVGYRQADMRAIAEEAGISIGSIYGKFHSKSELFLAVTSIWHDELISEIEAAFEATSDAKGRILKLAEILMQAIGERHGLWKDFFTDPEVLKKGAHGKDLMAEMEADWKKYTRHLEKLFLEAGPAEQFLPIAQKHPGRLVLVFRALVSFLPMVYPNEKKKNLDFLKSFMEALFL